MDFLLNWLLRGIFITLGVAAGLWILNWFRVNWRTNPERWTLRVAGAMVLLLLVYAVAHARLLVDREHIETSRAEYARFGDPRRTEERRGEVRGWILDCTGDPTRALASYHSSAAGIDRFYEIGEAGANFIGGGQGADRRDYTIEALFSDELRRPRSFLERGQLHAVGTDLPVTLCSQPTATAYEQLAATGRPGALVVQDVRTGAIVTYAATGAPEDPPLGVKRYSPPGSVFKLALSAVWWEHGMSDDIPIPCPSSIRTTERGGSISNFGNIGRGDVIGPPGMLIPSCNTAAVWMAWRLREEIGTEPFLEAYRSYGFIPYEDEPPTDTIGDFWRTTSDRWERRMTPAPSRLRMSENTGDAEWAQMAIGQGPVDVTVMGVSRFIQAIGNSGVMLPPTLESELAEDPPRGERVMSEQTARKLMDAMKLVVDQGTARAAAGIIGDTGWDMGGKTGTAQVAGRADNGWFAGLLFSPEGEPLYSIVSFVEGGGGGGGAPTRIAARVARDIAQNPPVYGGE